MRRIAMAFLGLVAALWVFGADAKTVLLFFKQPTVAAYTGPGDIVAGAAGWWGLRAYSAAARGTKSVNVCNVSDVACADLSTHATTGNLVITTIGGSDCSVVACTIKTFYDQSGNVLDVTQATIANRPVLTVSCVSSLPCATTTGSPITMLSAGTITFSQPHTFSAVIRQTTSAHQYMISANENGGARLGYDSSPQVPYIGSFGCEGTGSVNTWYATQGVSAAGAGAAVVAINGVETTCTDSTTSTAKAVNFFSNSASGNYFIGNLTEGGIWLSAFSAGNRSSMNSNQRTYWGI